MKQFLLRVKIVWGMGTIVALIYWHGKKIREGSASLDELLYMGKLVAHDSVMDIGEIGFNIGFSSLAFLLSNPKAKVISFDLGEWDAGNIAKQYIDKRFPGRHRLILGDSGITIPAFKKENPNFHFDVAFIDGGHSYEIAAADIKNIKELSSGKTIIIIDDLTPWLPWGKGPSRAWQEAVDAHMIVQKELVQDGVVVKKTEAPGKRAWAFGYYL